MTMATEAEKPEDVATSEAGDFNSLPPGIVGNSTRTEDSEIAQIIKDGILNQNNEGKVGNSGSDSFLESPSLSSKASEEISKDDTDSKIEPKPAMIKTHDDQTNETLEATCGIGKHDENDIPSKQVSKETSLDNARENEVGLVNSTSLSTTECVDEDGKIHPAVPITFLSDDLGIPEGLNEGGSNAVMDEMKQNNATPFDSKQGPIMKDVQSSDTTHHDHVTHSEDRKEETCPYQSTEEDTTVVSIQKDNDEGHKSGEDSDFKCKEENMVSDMEVEAHNKAEVMTCNVNTPNIYIAENPKQSKFEGEELESKQKSSNFVDMVKFPETISQTEDKHYRKGEVKTETEETSLQKSEADESCLPDITSNHLLDQTTVIANDSQKQRNDVNATETEIQEKDISNKIEEVDSKYEKVSEQLEKEKPKVEHDDIKEASPEMKNEDLDFQINDADDNTDKTSTVQTVEAHEINYINEVERATKDPIITTGELPGNEGSKEDTEVQNPGEAKDEVQTNRDNHDKKQKNEEDVTVEDLPKTSTKTENEVTEGVERAEETGKPITEEDHVPAYLTPLIEDEAILHDNEEDKVTGELERTDADKDIGEPITEEDVVRDNSRRVIEEEDKVQVTGESERTDADKDIGEPITEEDVVPDNSRRVIEEEDKVQVNEGLESADADKGTEETIIEENFVPDHSRTVIDEEAINHEHEEDKVIARMNIVGSDMDMRGSVIEEDVQTENSATTIGQEPIEGSHEKDRVIEGLEISNVEKDIQESNVSGDAVLDHSTITNADQPTVCGHDNKVIEGSERPNAENAIVDVPHHSTPTVGEEPMKDDQQEQKVKEVEIVTGDKDIGETIIEENVLEYSTTTIEKEPILHDEDKAIEKLEIDITDKTTGECFIEEGVVTDHSFIKEPTKDGHEKNKIVDGLETVGTDNDNNEPVRENDVVLDHVTTTIKENSVNDGHEEDKITAQLAITDANKDIAEPVIEEDIIHDQFATTIGEEPTKEGQKKEKVIEESEIVSPNKDIEEPTIEENVALGHSSTTILEKPIRDLDEDDKAIEDAIIEDVPITDHDRKAITEETLKDGLKENKVIEGLNIVGVDKDIDDSLTVENDKRDITSTIRENSIKYDHEEDNVTEGLQIVGMDKEIGDFSIKEIVCPDYSSTIIVDEPIRNDKVEEQVIDEVKIVEADSEVSEHVREEEVVYNSITTIMEEPTKDGHEEDEATEGLKIVHAAKDFEEPVIEDNVVPCYSTTPVGEQTMNDGHENEKEIEKLEIGGADQTTTKIGEEPIEDNHGENKVTETFESSSAHKDIDEHIIEEDVPDHSTTTNSDENITEGLEMTDANNNSGEAITEKNVAFDNCTGTTEQEPPKNGEENQVIQKLEISSAGKVIEHPILEYIQEHSTTTTGEEPVKEVHEENKVKEQIQTVVVDKETGGPIVEEIVAPNQSTTVIGEEASFNDLEEDEKITGLQVENTKKDNEGIITTEDLAQKHSTTTIQEEPTEDYHEENKDRGTIQVAAEGERTGKMDEDEMVIDLHEKSAGEETNEKNSQEYEASTKLAIGEASKDVVKQIITGGSITELSTISDRNKETTENSQEQMEAKKYTDELKELDLSMETTYQTPASTEKVETMTPSDETEQHKEQHADRVTDATIGETVVKGSEDLNDTSTGLKFEEPNLIEGSSSLVSEVSEEKVNNEILEEKESTEDGPNSLEGREKVSLDDAESECTELTESSEGVERTTSINDGENNTSNKEQGSINKLEESGKEETIATKLMDLGDHAIQNQEVVASFGLTSEEQNFKPVSLTERIECSDPENLTTHHLHDNRAKEESDIIPENNFQEKDIDGPRKEEQNVESFEKSKEPEIPQSWKERTIDVERTMIEQNELESMKPERTDESDAAEALEHNGVMERSHDATTSKEERSSKIFDTEAVEEDKKAEDDDVNDQSTVPCRYETANQSLINDEKEQKSIELERELEDDYCIHTRSTEQGSISKIQNEEVHKELEHTENEIMQDIIIKDHTTNDVEEVIVQENSPKDDKVSNTPEAKVKESDTVFMEEATDSTRETEISHLNEVEEEETKKSTDAVGTTETTSEEITMMETHDSPNYSSTESSVSEEHVMVKIPEKTESNINETIYATPLTEKLSLHETKTEREELVDASNLASAKIIDDNTTKDKFTTENSEAVAKEKSDIPVETSSIVLQSVDKHTETAPVEETTASKPSSDDIIERIPQEPSELVSAKEEISKIEMQVTEAPLLEQTKKEMIIQNEQNIKHEEDPAMVIENYAQKVLKPESVLETHISEQKDDDMILERDNITEVDEFRKSSRSETSEPSLKENQPESEKSSPKNLDTIDTCVDVKTDILVPEKDPIKNPDKNLEEKEIMNVEENVLNIHTTDKSEKLDEPCNTRENVTIAKNLEATDPCEEFPKPTETVYHNQGHEVLPEIEKTEAANNENIIKNQGTIFAGDCTVGQSIKEDEEKENDTLDKAGPQVDDEGKNNEMHDINHLMKEPIVNKEVPGGVEGTEGDNIEKQSREDEAPMVVDVSEDETRDKEVKDADFRSSEGITNATYCNEKTDAYTRGKELNQSVDASGNTEASTAEILKQEDVSNSASEDLGVVGMGTELDILKTDKTADACIKQGDGERMNLDNTVDLISEVQTTKNANIDEDSVTVRNDVIVESDIASKNIEESFEEDQKSADSAIHKELTSTELGELCKVDSNLVPDEHKEGGAEEHDTVDESAEETFQEKDKEDNIKKVKCESADDQKSKSNEVNEDTTTDKVLAGKPLEKESGLLEEMIHETVTKPCGNEEITRNDGSDPERLVEVKEPTTSIIGTMSTADNRHSEEEHPIDNHDASSLMEASQIEMQEKGGKSNQDETKGMVSDKINRNENSLPADRSEEDTEPKAPLEEMPKETVKEINDINTREENSATEEGEAQVVKQSDTPQDFKTLDQTFDELTEKHILEASPTEKSGTSIEAPSPPVDITQKSLQTAETEEGKHGEPQENESDGKKVCEEEKTMHSSDEETNIVSKSPEAGRSLLDLLHKSRENTGQAAEQSAEEQNSPHHKEESENKDAPTVETKKVDRTDEHEDAEGEGEAEDGDEHKKDDSGSDAPVMVEASRDIDVKPTPKKSHNILSGVGSKVKHSISKVKKAIIGKSSHQKQLSPK